MLVRVNSHSRLDPLRHHADDRGMVVQKGGFLGTGTLFGRETERVYSQTAWPEEDLASKVVCGSDKIFL